MSTIRLTAAQALVRYLSTQVNEDGGRFVAGVLRRSSGTATSPALVRPCTTPATRCPRGGDTTKMAESAPFDFAPLTRSYAQDERYRGVATPSVS